MVVGEGGGGGGGGKGSDGGLKGNSFLPKKIRL